ncbi:MAG: DUF6763 family protein [Candidatus Macondimonas sp.]
MGELDPIVGQWYLDLEQDERFKVLALDERGDEVEVEYEDGEIRTLSFDEWYDLDLDVFQEEEDEPHDDVVEPKNDFSRPTQSRRYREEDDEDEDDLDEDEDEDDLDEDWDDR